MVRLERFLRVLRLIWHAVRLVAPLVWGAFLFTARLIAVAVISLWIGVPKSLDNMANDWLDRAVIAGFPTLWDRQLYYFFWCLGLVTVVTGWVLFSFITVGVVHLIF
jgi:hypothetical protein